MQTPVFPAPGHPSPAKPPDDVFGRPRGAPARGWGRARWAAALPLEGWGVGGAGAPSRPLPTFPPFSPSQLARPPPLTFPPLTTPWTRNSKSLLFVALRAPPATSSAAIGVGSAAPLTLSLSLLLFLSLFCLFFFFPPTLPSESCWALSHFYSSGVGRGPLQKGLGMGTMGRQGGQFRGRQRGLGKVGGAREE